MKASKVFEKNYNAFNENYRIIANRGGARSGKTYSILQLFLYIAIQSEEPIILSVVSESVPHLKRGCCRDFENILASENLIEGKDYYVNRTDNVYTFNKSKIEFFSADNGAKLLGSQRDYLFINECNHLVYNAFCQLEIRTSKKIWLDWNPSSTFWYEEFLENREGTITIHSTYKDNPFLSKEQVASLESHRGNNNFWRVYGLGLIGQLEGAIYQFTIVDELPQNGVDCYGMDFGFSNDPTTIVHCKINNGKKEIYADEICYRSGMLNSDIINCLRNNDVDSISPIYADCAEPKSIAEISRSGYHILPSNKGGSNGDRLLHQIQWMQGWTIYVTKRSYNLIKELENYTWEKDINGNSINKPIDKFNHLLDAMRYAVFTKFGGGNGTYSISF